MRRRFAEEVASAKRSTCCRSLGCSTTSLNSAPCGGRSRNLENTTGLTPGELLKCFPVFLLYSSNFLFLFKHLVLVGGFKPSQNLGSKLVNSKLFKLGPGQSEKANAHLLHGPPAIGHAHQGGPTQPLVELFPQQDGHLADQEDAAQAGHDGADQQGQVGGRTKNLALVLGRKRKAPKIERLEFGVSAILLVCLSIILGLFGSIILSFKLLLPVLTCCMSYSVPHGVHPVRRHRGSCLATESTG